MSETLSEPASAEPAPARNFALAVPAGLGAAIAGAVLWAVFTYVTSMELGLIAVAVGALVGLAIRAAGKGRDKRFQILGAACAAFGCILGILLSDIAFAAKELGQPLSFVVAQFGVGGILSLATQASDVMELVFVAIAIWEGYKLSVLPAVTDEPA